MIASTITIIWVIILCALSFIGGCFYEYHTSKGRTPEAGSPSRAPDPRIIVNVPANFQPMEPLPEDKTLSGAAAQLWWSVYRHGVDNCIDDAHIDANNAVAACFPNL